MDKESSRARAVRLVCWQCKERYAFVVDPNCILCEGAGVIAAPVPIGISPQVAARAASIHLDGFRRLDPAAVAERRAAGRIEPDSPQAVGLARQVPSEGRQTVGTFASALLKGKSLPPKAWDMIAPGDITLALAETIEIAKGLL